MSHGGCMWAGPDSRRHSVLHCTGLLRRYSGEKGQNLPQIGWQACEPDTHNTQIPLMLHIWLSLSLYCCIDFELIVSTLWQRGDLYQSWYWMEIPIWLEIESGHMGSVFVDLESSWVPSHKRRKRQGNRIHLNCYPKMAAIAVHHTVCLIQWRWGKCPFREEDYWSSLTFFAYLHHIAII